MIQVECTKDYSQFSLFSQQRELRPDLAAKIQASMRKRGFKATRPIEVNDKMEIVDGQHRYQAAKNLGLPIYYVVDNGSSVEDIREMASATAAWSFNDYVTSRIRQGDDDCKRVAELRELSGLGWSAFIYACFTDSERVRLEIRAGKFDLTETKQHDIIEFLTTFEVFKPLCSFWTQRNFTLACAAMFAHKDYDHRQMQQRLEYQSTRLVRCANASQYLKMLEGIYNYRSHSAHLVDFSRSIRSVK